MSVKIIQERLDSYQCRSPLPAENGTGKRDYPGSCLVRVIKN